MKVVIEAFLVLFPLAGFLLTLAHSSAATQQQEDPVWILTISNFSEVIQKHSRILVDFYAPGCKHCEILAPEYAKAAEILQKENSHVKLAKVDITTEPDLATQFSIKAYPTLLYFYSGRQLEYSGGQTATSIVKWIKVKERFHSVYIENLAVAERITDVLDVIVIGFFQDLKSETMEIYEWVARMVTDIGFAHTDRPKIFEFFNVTQENAMVLLKKFDEGRNEFFGPFVEHNMLEFVMNNKEAMFLNFSIATAGTIFDGSIKKQLLAFFSSAAENSAEIKEMFQLSARHFQNKVLFVHVDTNIKENLDFVRYFEVNPSITPVAYLMTMFDAGVIKYLPKTTGSVNKEQVVTFVQNVLDGVIPPHIRSQKIPTDWDKKPVKELVGQTFLSVTRDLSKSVFVELYAPMNELCEDLEPIWEQLGEMYKNHPEIVIAKMDSIQNEPVNVQIRGYPTIVLFPKNSKRPVEYEGEQNLAAFIEFLNSYDSTKYAHTEL